MALCLVIDDERTFRMVAEEALRTAGYDVQTAGTATAGLKLWRALGPEVVILDRNLPDMDGLDLLRQQKAERTALRDCQVILVTAYADVESAVEALKLGAYDYLTKPLQLAELTNTVRNAMDALRMHGRLDVVQQRETATLSQIEPGQSPAMHQVFELVDKVAQSPTTTVLIAGESGVGKQIVAELVHARTPRRAPTPFVDLNCAAMPEALLESELFGHEKGAFTDAKETKRGLLEVADEGTLFLDEVGELPPGMQAKLLKVLDSMTFRRVGGTRDRRVNVRIVAASNKDLEREVREHRFRFDLYHRLAVFRLDVPPLRERHEDILPLARHFLGRLARQVGKPLEGFSKDAEAALLRYPYPGNVRELKNIVERAVVLESGNIVQLSSLLLRQPSSFAPAAGADSPSEPIEGFFRAGATPPTLDQVEHLYIARLLQFTGGNRAHAARILDVSYPTIQKKIRDYGIQ